MGSPYGTIRGKLNGTVATVWRGIQVIRQLKKPTDRGPILRYQQYKDGEITIDRFSFKQFNWRRLIYGPLQRIAVDNMDWIHVAWTPETIRKHQPMQGINAFLKKNLVNFYASLPNKDQEYDPITNAPNLLTLRVADGPLEPTPEIKKAEYDTGSGELDINWDTSVTYNGNAGDTAYGLVLALPLLDSYGRYGNWQPALSIQFFGTIGVRSMPTSPIQLDPGLDPDNLYFFVFFYSEIGLSQSLVMQTTEPPPP